MYTSYSATANTYIAVLLPIQNTRNNTEQQLFLELSLIDFIYSIYELIVKSSR